MLFYAYSQHSDSIKLFFISVQLKYLAFSRNIQRQLCCFQMNYIYNRLLYSQLSRQAFGGRVGCVAGEYRCVLVG